MSTYSRYLTGLVAAPHTAMHADDLCVIRSMHADTAAHASGCLQMNTGSIFIGKPCLGSWLNYGLGTANQDLPGFVVMTDPRGGRWYAPGAGVAELWPITPMYMNISGSVMSGLPSASREAS